MASPIDEQLVVLKLGGSLLSLSDWPDRLHKLMTLLRIARPLLIVGGGATADLVRHWQSVHSFSDEAAHQLALQAMSLNEALVKEVLGDAPVVTDRLGMQTVWAAENLPILSAISFLKHEEPLASQKLPHDWSATSDSIAAWVAHQLPADHLVLLKSVDLPDDTTLQEAVDAGLVDDHFPELVQQLNLTWVNLRSTPLRPCQWVSSDRATGQSPHEDRSLAQS